MDAEVI